MARNLQYKLHPSDTVRLYDINKDAMEKLAQEMRASKAGGAAVHLAETAADAAREAVCLHALRVLSMPSI
jgi:3-hydroxyisobutyrate dehydrogenase